MRGHLDPAPDSTLMRKSKGKESKLSFGGHALMENRHGLCVDLKVTEALLTEPRPPKRCLIGLDSGSCAS
jgi:hypothetical protein